MVTAGSKVWAEAVNYSLDTKDNGPETSVSGPFIIKCVLPGTCYSHHLHGYHQYHDQYSDHDHQYAHIAVQILLITESFGQQIRIAGLYACFYKRGKFQEGKGGVNINSADQNQVSSLAQVTPAA